MCEREGGRVGARFGVYVDIRLRQKERRRQSLDNQQNYRPAKLFSLSYLCLSFGVSCCFFLGHCLPKCQLLLVSMCMCSDSEAASTTNRQCPAGSLDISSQQAQGQYAAEERSCYYSDMLAVGNNYSQLHPYTNSNADRKPVGVLLLWKIVYPALSNGRRSIYVGYIYL